MMGPGLISYSQNLRTHFEDVPSTVFDQARDQWRGRFEAIKKMNGKENPYTLHQDLGNILLANVLIVRENSKLEKALAQIGDLEIRFSDVQCLDTTHWSNPAPSMIQQLHCQIQLAKIITKGALIRNEFRGAHYKPEFDLDQPGDFDPHEYVEYIEKKQYGEIQEEDFPPGHAAYMKRFEKCNERWLKTTIAEHKDHQPEISFEEVNTSLIQPRPRKYD
jgi:succinate dehydrogenase / fumarate reductase flavoprotein subunit